MTELMTFQFRASAIRVVVRNGEPWFVAADVASVLGYAQAKDFTRMLRDKEKGRHSVPTLGGPQDMEVVSESGLYRGIFGSRVDEAEPFKDWVCEDVLPAIRKTGAYVHPGLADDAASIERDDDDDDDAGDDDVGGASLPESRLYELRVCTNLVRLALRLGGKSAALTLWRKLPLPPLEDTGEIDVDLASFLAEHCELDPGSRVPLREFSTAFEAWNQARVGRNEMGRLMRRAGYTVKHARFGRRVCKAVFGLRLKPAA